MVRTGAIASKEKSEEADIELNVETGPGSEEIAPSGNAENLVASARRAGEDPAPQTSKSRTFYCWFGGSGKINGVEQSVRPSNMQIPIGGERRMDASNRVINAPFKMIEFVDGIFRTDDPDMIEVLVRMMKNSPNITENQDEYLSRILPQDKALDRLQAKLDEQRIENNRLRDQLKRGQAPNLEPGPKHVTGPISSGAVPRRGGPRS